MSTLTVMSDPETKAKATVLRLAEVLPLDALDLAAELVARADRALAHVHRVDADGTPHGHKDNREPRDDSEMLRPVERT